MTLKLFWRGRRSDNNFYYVNVSEIKEGCTPFGSWTATRDGGLTAIESNGPCAFHLSDYERIEFLKPNETVPTVTPRHAP